MRDSMRSVESRFNKKFGYPWVFLNDEPFDEAFKVGVRKMTRSEVIFGEHFPRRQKLHWLSTRTDVRYIQRKFRKSTGAIQAGSTRRTLRRNGRRWWMRA